MSAPHNLLPASPPASADRVPFTQKIAIGVGGFPFLTGTMVFNYMAQPIYQIVLGLNPAWFGLAMTIPRLWDAFTDPVMGAVSDNFRSRWGRRRPFIFAGSLLSALTFAAVWFVPRDASQQTLFAYLVVTGLLYFTSLTIFSVPLTSLSYEMTPDYHERTRVMAFWGFFATCANLAINWYAPLTHSAQFSDPLTGARWVGIGIALVIFIGLGLIPAVFVRERLYAKARDQVKISFWSAIRQTAGSRPMLTLVSLLLLLNFCGAIAGSLAQYIVIYHVCGGDVKAGLVLNSLNGTGFAIVGFAFIPIITWAAGRFGKRGALYLVLGMSALGGLAKWVIFTPNHPHLLLLDSVLNGPVWVAIGIVVPSMMADLCDDDEHRHGQRREGIISAVFTWIMKVGLSLTFLFSGFALAVSGFDATRQGAQSEAAITMMRLLFTGASVVAPLLGMLCLRLYPIDERRAGQIRRELEARRGTV